MGFKAPLADCVMDIKAPLADCGKQLQNFKEIAYYLLGITLAER